MRNKILILVITICILLSACTNQKRNIEQDEVDATLWIPPSYTFTPQPQYQTTKPIESQNPESESTPAQEFNYVSLPEVDYSYTDNTIQSDNIVFDKSSMYYVNGNIIIKRNTSTGAESIIYEGVYDNRHLSIQDDWLYFYTRGKGIIKVKTDGTQMEVIKNVQAKEVMIVGDYLYYYVVVDYHGDWPYSLFELNLKTNENRIINKYGMWAVYVNNELYYTSYDGMQNDLQTYDTTTKQSQHTEISCYSMPIIVGNTAYCFFGEWGDSDKLQISNLKTKEEKTMEIEGTNLTRYYNYLFYIDNDFNLNAFDVKTENNYLLMSFKDKLIDIVYEDKIYVGSRDDVGNVDYYLMEINDKTTLTKQFALESFNNYEAPESNMLHITDLEKNNDWADLQYGIFSFNFSGEKNEPIQYEDKYYYSTHEKRRIGIYVDDGVNSIKLIDNGVNSIKLIDNGLFVDGMPLFIIINDRIYYYSENDPGILCEYNIQTKNTNEFVTGMGYPVNCFIYYQYLIIDSYYKEYNYDFLDENSNLSREELNPVYSIAINMETGEIIHIENDYLE